MADEVNARGLVEKPQIREPEISSKFLESLPEQVGQ